MSFRQKILITLLSLVLLYSVYFWGIPNIVNIKHNITYLENFVYDQAGVKVKINNPTLKMGLLPSVWLKADSFNIVNSDNSNALSIKNPNLEVSLLKFLIGKCNITYFSADSINANIRYEKNSKLYLGDYLIPKNADSSAIDVNHLKLNIQNYYININDKSTNQKITLDGDYFTISKLIQNKRYNISANIDLAVDNIHSSVNFDTNIKLPLNKYLSRKNTYINATITNLDFAILSKYISYFTNNDYRDLSGKLNFEAHTSVSQNGEKIYICNFILENFGIDGKNFAQPYKYSNKVSFSSKLKSMKNDLYIKDLIVKAKDLNVNIDGVVNKITSNNQKLNLNISSKNSKAEALVDLLPANNYLFDSFGLDFDIETLVKAKFFADVNFDLKVTGDAQKPDTFGDLFITNAYVTKTPISNGAKKATINLKFDKDRVYLDNVHVPASTSEYVDVRGWVELFDKKNVDLTITSTKNVDLGIAQYVLMPVHRVLRFELGPVPIMNIKGKGNIVLKVKGNKGDPHTFGIFNFSKGIVSFNDINNMVIKNASGSLEFKDTNTIFKTKSAVLNGQPITVDGTCDLHGNLNFDVKTNNQQVNDLINILKTSPMLNDIASMVKQINTKSGHSDFVLNLKGHVIDATKIKFGENIFANGHLKLSNVSANLAGLSLPITNISGYISFNNTDLKMMLESAIRKSKISIKGQVKNNISDINIASNNMYADDLIDYISNSKLLPYAKNTPNRRGMIIFTANYTGGIDKIDYTKLKVDGSASFNNYRCYYKPYKMPIDISNANISIKNSVLNIYGMNIKLSEMPVFLKGKVNNIYAVPNLNLYITLKPNQPFANAVFNRNAIYPIKIKGDISNTIYVSGNLDNYNLKSTLMIGNNSKIYYMGATLGDDLNSMVINLDANVKKDSIYIHNLTNDVIKRTNKNRMYPVRELSVSGGIKYLNNDILFDNFKIKTLTPTDSRFFNLIFKKPYIKQGQFNSDIKVNGSLMMPKILGTFSVKNIEIPNYFINIQNTNLNFQSKNITTEINGKIFGSPFKLKSSMDNNLKKPYKINDLKLYITDVNLNEISNSARKLEMESHEKMTMSAINPLDFGAIIVNNAQLYVDNIYLDNIKLYDLIARANFSINKVFSLNEFQFKTAKGKISGDYSVNLKNNKHTASVSVDGIDAKIFTETLFNLHNQIAGNVDGKMDVTCTGLTQEACLKTLTGNAGFSIKNGNMPKLGSLEYLLNAANIVKSGITGLSLNGLIDLITPLRTGIFDSISGTISVKNGLCNDIQIFSQSKNLNLFIKGTYNLTTSIAKMKIFGRLTRNTSSILGPIGNASLNALFNTLPLVDLSSNNDNSILEYINKIPAIELNSRKYRIFTVDINGDINGNEYVKSFNWVE